MSIWRWLLSVWIIRCDPLINLAGVCIAQFQHIQCTFVTISLIKSQTRLAVFFVWTVAVKAAVRQQGADVPIEVDLGFLGMVGLNQSHQNHRSQKNESQKCGASMQNAPRFDSMVLESDGHAIASLEADMSNPECNRKRS